MKRKWLRILSFLLLILLLPGFLLLKSASLPSVYAESYYAELAEMTKRLDEAPGKKIVIVGGSNVAFGLDVSLLENLLAEKGFDYTVCPYGLYAAVGSSAMLSLSESALDEGDLVVLAVEPTDETFSDYFGATAFLKCTEDAPGLLTRLSAAQTRAVLGNWVSYLRERAEIVRSGVLPKAEGVYSRAAFGENCNLDYERAGNLMALGFDGTEPIDLAALHISESFQAQVNDYCRAAERKGAQVLMSFSPMNRSALTDGSQETLDSFFALCNSSFVCPVISDPARYVLDSAWFYDSNFHLNSAGAEVRTVLLAEDILARLGCTEAVEHPLPEAPASIFVPPAAAENTGDFLFEPVADSAGWSVVGLTEQGAEKSVLELPSSYAGKPVVAFAAGAFDEAARLEELRLPESIETIPNLAFIDCPWIQRLVLLHESAPCGVSDYSFEGADALRVFVPAAAWPMYRDGFGCETNPWTVHLDRIYTY